MNAPGNIFPGTTTHAVDQRVIDIPGKGIFVPVLLLAIAVIGAVGLQTWQNASERQVLQVRLAGLFPHMQAAQRMRASLDSLAVATQALATSGNPNARAMVDELQRRGMTIDSSKPPQRRSANP